MNNLKVRHLPAILLLLVFRVRGIWFSVGPCRFRLAGMVCEA